MNYRGYCITSTYDSGVERDNKIVEGYYCEVFRASDENYADKLDDFCLGVGYEISDISSDSLDEALKQYIDDNIVVLNDICYKANIERYKNLIQNALDWFSEHFESEELLDILHEHLDMTDEEIDYFGFDFSDLEQDNRFSVFCMKDYEDSVFFTTAIPNDLYCAASTYHYYIKDDVGRDSLDSLAGCFSDQQFIDEQVFSVLCSAISKEGKIASLIEFDFDSNQLRYCASANDMWQTYDLQDISEAVAKSNADNTLNYSARKNIFFENLEGIETTESESESPSMSM